MKILGVVEKEKPQSAALLHSMNQTDAKLMCGSSFAHLLCQPRLEGG